MVDLKSKIPGAENFRYYEFIKSQVALRLGIDNTPSPTHWTNIERLAVNCLQPIRTKFGRIRITSGYRSVPLCLRIGSSPSSNHARGQAADIEPISSRIKLFKIAEWAYHNLEFRTIICEYFPNGWIHIDYREGGNLKRLQLKDKNHNYQTIEISYLKDLYGKV